MPRSTSERLSYGLAGAATPIVPPSGSGFPKRVAAIKSGCSAADPDRAGGLGLASLRVGNHRGKHVRSLSLPGRAPGRLIQARDVLAHPPDLPVPLEHT